ncbi:hypothetical protein Q5424_17990 [Conexibacter sp. JD483]|uniref:hypothetical protein n=1 Tax=unclassified Conexibacter TaxID=2627773 RepID=UPI00272A85DC|nr:MULTISPECIES: hypothetical protein [unclassified Conexibacter]MDR9370993.1 hypothetical protein [Conexibacter sp. JD483]
MTLRLESALAVQIPPSVKVSGMVPVSVIVDVLVSLPVIVPAYRQVPPRMFVTRSETAAVATPVVRLELIVMSLLFLAAVIVPLQPLAVNAVTEPLAPVAEALIPLRLQEPLPSDDMVVKVPVPALVL